MSRNVASSTKASPREDFEQRDELILLGHVPRDHRQHRAERRERHVGRRAAPPPHEQQQVQRVQDAGDRPARAGADVGRGARDGAGDADAAEHRRADVGDALRDQLAVRAMAAAGHAVRDHGRQQRLDRTEQGEGDARRAARRASSPREVGSAGVGSGAECRRSASRWSRHRQRRARQAARAASTTAIRKPGHAAAAPQRDDEDQRRRRAIATGGCTVLARQERVRASA